MATIKSRKFVDLHYPNGTVSDVDGVIYPMMESLTIPVEGIKFYGSAFLRIMELERCAISFYLWCLMEMSDSMIISTTAYQRKRFITFAGKRGAMYKDVTVYKSIKGIVEAGLFIKIDKGTYKINPEYAYIGANQDRKKQVNNHRRNTADNKKFVVNDEGDITKLKL